MISALVYTAGPGAAAQYAQRLAGQTHLPVYSLRDARSALADGAEILYLGWIMASSVKGYADAAKRYRVRMVCAVGMAVTGSQLTEVRKASSIPEDMALFTLQGGFHPEKLNAGYRLMMRMMRGVLIRQIAE